MAGRLLQAQAEVVASDSPSLGPVKGLVGPVGPVSNIGKYFSRIRCALPPGAPPWSTAFIARRPYFLSVEDQAVILILSFEHG